MTNQANISGAKLAALTIPLPPLAEQKRIVANVEHRLSVFATIEPLTNGALEETKELRTSLFYRALSGKLIQQRRSDEPASKLLSRIHKLKDQLTKEPKSRAFTPPRPKLEKLPMLTLEDIKPTHLSDILRQHDGPLDAKALWKESQLTIDDFYAQLKNELGKTLRETGKDRLLEVKS